MEEDKGNPRVKLWIGKVSYLPFMQDLTVLIGMNVDEKLYLAFFLYLKLG